jgi:site-specific DNA-methyltransferase (adenine-specific)
LQIIEKSITEIKPYEKNPRKNDEAVEYVANSIKQFGFKVPIVIDKNGVIVAGHTRYKAAKELGLEKLPCIIADDLTEEQVKAFRLADNKVGEFAEWDFDLLGEELDGIFDIDMSELGFDLDVGLHEEPAEVKLDGQKR